MADDTLILTATVKPGGIEGSVATQWNNAQRYVQSRPLQLRLDASRFPLGKITNDARAFDQAIGAATTRVTAFAAAAAVFLTIRRSFELLVHSTIEVERELAKVNINLNESADGLKAFGQQVFAIARQTGQTFETAAKAAGELSKQGLGAAETAKRLKDALILSRYAGIDASDAVKNLTVAVNTFHDSTLTTTDVLDKYIAVSRRFANVSGTDITQAFERVGETAQQAGVDINTLLGYITAIQRETGRGGNAIGTSLNTIFNRLNQPKFVDQLQEKGIATRSKTGELLPVPQLLQNIASRYQQLDKIQQQNILTDVAQSRQVGILRALLIDLNKEYSVTAQTIGVVTHATGESDRVQEKLNNTLATRIQNLSTSTKQFFSAIGEEGPSQLLKGIIDAIDHARQYLSGDSGSVLGKILGDGIVKGLGAVISGPAIVALFGIVIRGAAVAFDKIRGEAASLLDLNGIAEARSSIQTRINQLLYAANDAERAQVEAAGSLLARKEAILAIATRISAEEARAASISAATIEAFVGRGALGGAKPDPRLRRNFAGGYNPAISRELSAISNGVGGASSSAKPVAIQNFAFGGGVTGPIVANSDEYLVKNYANGGSAIFNPAMVKAYGLPVGATKVGSAAGGYVPNAAGGFDYNQLRFQAGTVGNVASGFFVPKSEVDKLNKLFEAVRKAGSTGAAEKFGVQIQNLNATFDKASQSQVFKKLGEEFNALYMKGKIIRNGGGSFSAEAFEATRTPATLREIAAQSAFIRKNNPFPAELLPDQNRPATGNINTFFSGQTPFDPAKIQDRRSRLAKLRGALSGRGSTLALAFAAPFASGFIDDGAGGTAGGQTRGAIKGALSGAGIGAIAGPYGAAAGAVIGGIVGALSKATQSVEEFSASLSNSKTKDALTALYAITQGSGGKLAGGALAGQISPETLAKLRPHISELLATAYNPNPTLSGDVKRTKATLGTAFGPEFAELAGSTRSVGPIAKAVLDAILIAAGGIREAAEDAKKKALAQASAGLQPNAFLARNPEAASAVFGLGAYGRGGAFQRPYPRANATLAGFQALIEANPESKEEIIKGNEYKRALAVTQRGNLLDIAGALVKSRNPDFRLTNDQGTINEGGITQAVGRYTKSSNPRVAELSQALFKALGQSANGVANAGGPGLSGSADINSGGYPLGEKTTGYSGDLGGTLKAAQEVAKKLSNVTVQATLQVDGTVELTSQILSPKQLDQMRDELNRFIGNHFTDKISDINRRIGKLEGTPVPPKTQTVIPAAQ